MAFDRAEWRAGWPTVLGVAFGVGGGIALYQYVSSLFLGAITEAEGLSRGALTGLSALGLLGALCAPLVGLAADRFGVARTATFCTLAMGAAWAGIATLPFSPVTFAVLFACVSLFGMGTTGLVYMRAVVGWFERSRGMALGFAASGVSVYAILTPPLFQMVLSEHGWRAGVWLLAGIACLIALPMALLLVRERPRAMGRRGGMSLRTALGLKPTWLLIVAIGAVNFASTGILSQLALIFQDKGFAPSDAALLLSVYAASVMAGRLMIGLALDVATPHHVAWAATSASIAGCLCLLAPTPLWAVALGAVILVGMQQGSEGDLFAFFVSRFCGVAAFSSVMGALFVSLALSIAAGVATFGALFDATKSYDLALWVAIAAFAVGAIALGLLGLFTPSEQAD